MTSAAMQADVLDALLAGRGDLDGLWRPYYRRAAKVVDMAWRLAVGEDFRCPTTTGPKPAGTTLVNHYVARMHRATHVDPVVYRAFLDVMNLKRPATQLLAPGIVWRVMRGGAPSRDVSAQ